ncbi:unnamed protein product [Mytilus coruscus]|uniref:Uncharacterized protein n=1 Tax=Mytilus coruscus TaxID=42192 RepID=A0A6J8D3B1_MYTCO|nr:unnamed protein product [Mytilus coruscus]
MYDICDGEFIRNSPFFQQNPNAIQVILNADDVEIVNPLGSHIKKHKLTMFYFTKANIPPQYRSKLHVIQLLAIAKTNDLRVEKKVMKLTNFSITSGLVQDPMHVFLEGILPKELSSLLFHLVFTQKLFTLKWLNGKIRSFNYSYLHIKNKPEETFEKGDVENCTHIKQSSSALHTSCQILPLILGPKVELDNEHWINFLRLVQIVLLCLSSYCNRETASVLRILIGLYLRISRRFVSKSFVCPKKSTICCIYLNKCSSMDPSNIIAACALKLNSDFLKLKNLQQLQLL